MWSNTTSGSSAFDALALQETIRESVANITLSSGITLYSQKKYTQAAQAFKQAAAMNPALAQAYTYLGYTQMQQGKQQDAIKSLTLSLKVDKTQDQVYSDLANLYIDMRKPADAEKTLQNAIKQNNQNTLAYYTLGQLQSQRGDNVDAEKQFRKVIRLEPNDGNGYYALGMALNGQGRYSEAITQLNRATSLKQDFVAAISELGKAYNATGDAYSAQRQVDKLNKIGSSDAKLAAQNLTTSMTKPAISDINASGTTLPYVFGTIPLLVINPMNTQAPGAAQDITIKFDFNSDMDASSVTNIANWSITKASGGAAGLYNNGLYSPKSVNIPAIPKQVTYDPVNNQAVLTFTVHQNATGDGTIDPSHLVFKFKGVDANGNAMDPTANAIDGFSNTPFGA
jgi:tetratricopeptide (TPR) repeat protein